MVISRGENGPKCSSSGCTTVTNDSPYEESRNAECKCRIGDAQPTSEHLELLELPTAHGADQHQLTSATKAWSRLETERTPFLDLERRPSSCFWMLRASKACERAGAGVERTYNEDVAAERPKECTGSPLGSCCARESFEIQDADQDQRRLQRPWGASHGVPASSGARGRRSLGSKPSVESRVGANTKSTGAIGPQIHGRVAPSGTVTLVPWTMSDYVGRRSLSERPLEVGS